MFLDTRNQTSYPYQTTGRSLYFWNQTGRQKVKLNPTVPAIQISLTVSRLSGRSCKQISRTVSRLPGRSCKQISLTVSRLSGRSCKHENKPAWPAAYSYSFNDIRRFFFFFCKCVWPILHTATLVCLHS